MSQGKVGSKWHRPDPGSLRHQLIVQRNLAPKSGSGGILEDWSTVCVVYGDIKPMRGGESFDPAWAVSGNTYCAVIRQRSDITEQMRILFGSRVFQIRSAPFVSRDDMYMEITCEEVKA